MRQIDGKYKINDSGVLVKLDGTPLPEDEPLILFRAHDPLLPELLERYNELCIKAGCPQSQMDLLKGRIGLIKKWQAANPDKLKLPD